MINNYLKINRKRHAYSRAIDRLLIQEQAEKAAALLPRYKMLQAAEKELLNEIKSKKMCEIHNEDAVQKELKPSINIDQLKSLMLQYLQEAANEEDDSDIEEDTDKWARKILGYDFEQKEQKPVEDWRENRKKECPFRKTDSCKRYADVISECTGACSWVVDYPRLKEIQDKQEQKPSEWMDLKNYISNTLRELGADLINHKLNVGQTNAYQDILDRLNTRKEG